MPSDTDPDPETYLTTTLDGQVVMVRATGEQTGPEAALVRQKLVRLLAERGCEAVLVDLRDASYDERRIRETADRQAALTAVIPPGRVAVWHRNEDPHALSFILDGFRRAGHLAWAVQSLDEAAHYLLDNEDPDIVAI